MDDSRKNRIISMALNEAKKKVSSTSGNNDADNDLIRERAIRYFDEHFSVDENRSDEISEQKKDDVVVISLDTLSVSYYELWLDFTAKKKCLVNTKTGELYYSKEEMQNKFQDIDNLSSYDLNTFASCMNIYEDFTAFISGEKLLNDISKDRDIIR